MGFTIDIHLGLADHRLHKTPSPIPSLYVLWLLSLLKKCPHLPLLASIRFSNCSSRRQFTILAGEFQKLGPRRSELFLSRSHEGEVEGKRQGCKIRVCPRVLDDQKMSEDNQKLRCGCPPDYQNF